MDAWISLATGCCQRLRLPAVLFCLAFAAIAQGATITVDGSCKFEDALYAADRDTATGNCPAGSGDDTIALKANVTLTRVLEQVDSKITISGGGYTIDGAGEFAFINNQSGGEVIINNLTLTNAWTDNDSWVIQNYGKMTVADSAFIDNGKARHGVGGVFNYGATISDGFLTISNSTIRTTAKSVRAVNVNSNAQGAVTLSHATLYTPNYVGLYVTGDGRGIVKVRNSIIAGDFYAQCWIPKFPNEPAEPTGSDLLAEFVGNLVANTTPATKNQDNLCKNRLRSAGLGSLTGSPGYFPLDNSSRAIGIGNTSVCAAFPTDQAGNSRPGTGCDAGAIENALDKPVSGLRSAALTGDEVAHDLSRSQASELAPRYSTCAAFTERIIVKGWNLGAQCQETTTDAAIGDPQIIREGWIMAVDIWGWLDAGLEVCFEAVGKLTLLEAAYAPRLAVPLQAYSWQGHTCAWVDRPGNVILQASDSPAPQLQPWSREAWSLSNCMVRTTASLYFRASPAGSVIGGVRKTALLTALERTADWFLVDYHGARGWISADFVEPQGQCG